jgi:hypothetical protein
MFDMDQCKPEQLEELDRITQLHELEEIDEIDELEHDDDDDHNDIHLPVPARREFTVEEFGKEVRNYTRAVDEWNLIAPVNSFVHAMLSTHAK